MHELSIAHSLVTTVAGAVGDALVTEVHIAVGALAGVVPMALQFAWEVAGAETPLAGSVLVITWVPARIHCATCDLSSDVTGSLVLVCPHCGQGCGDIRAGRELLISHVVVEDEVGVPA